MSVPSNGNGSDREPPVGSCPRLGPADRFRFSCHPGLSCYGRCCSDVNIFLSPYDVLRMKRRLDMRSGEFLDRYTILPLHEKITTPVVVLKMKDDSRKSCPFLTEEGCGIYSDRPWPCRMYPLGLAARRDTPDGWRGERVYFLLREEGCEGFAGEKEWTVREWMEEQGIGEYDDWGEAYKELVLHEFFEKGGSLAPQKMHMLFTACYDLDKFREFVFESTLLQRFDVDEDLVEEMRYSDEALLRFGFLWVRFSLFGERTVKVRPDIIEAFRGRLDKSRVFGRSVERQCREDAP